MSRVSVMTGVKRAGLWCALVVVVLLFTLVFNFLGTLTTAVLAGMMAGALGRFCWEIIPVSLVFPGVLMALGQAAKSDLDLRQRISLAGLCCGAFWAAHIFTFLLMRLEKKSAPALPGGATHAPVPEARELPPQEEGSRVNGPTGTTMTEAPEPAPSVSLLEFEGRWVCEMPGSDGQSATRQLEIGDGQFALKITRSGECPRLVARGRVRMDTPAAASTLVISGE